MVECFDAITIDAKHLYFKIRFFETLSSFCIFEKALFLDTRDSILETRDSILETRSSNVSSIEARASSLEVRVSSVNLLLSGTVLRVFREINWSILPYLPVYNVHFFFVKLTSKFAMRIIHGSHCLPKFSLAYCEQKLHTSWFSITLIEQTTNKESVISILE